MRIAKFICDGCEKTAETKGTWPEGWLEFNILVGVNYVVPPVEQIHACSKACAVRGASKHLTSYCAKQKRMNDQ